MLKPSVPPGGLPLENPQLDLPLFSTANTSAPPSAGASGASGSEATPQQTPAATSSPAADGSKRRSLTLGAQTLQYQLKRSARRSIGFSIDSSGLSITAPRWVTLAEIENAISEKQRWIFTKLNEWQTRVEQRALPRIDWKDGAQVPYLGRPVSITLDASSGALRFDAEHARLTLPLPLQAEPQQIKDRVQGWLQGEAKRLFGERLAFYAEKLGVSYRGYALSSAATRWGSCSSDGKIRLNWRLVHFPLPVIDYVVAHELAHLREMNHSPRFWQTVESIFPEFRQVRQTLKDHPPELLPTL
ncbi:SprT family zinc-dependent metalloprotease [Paraburkholderia bonniea]|uniref:M48 family metallopeptidase n=1 Tax=Paraburkholderia bonniea TaxID=2152891 RepID=UPI00257321ED|nr:SprT family zinc-dependent metalloprotease [Paraburkholderia bonniea]WJF90721.1 SprT family zinc-dependent metalloprotease [Paraburkholderia bonniea]WJF94034.1 SprT family zinc-dependent metalloprotease [Paraburkholderia bonniea]